MMGGHKKVEISLLTLILVAIVIIGVIVTAIVISKKNDKKPITNNNVQTQNVTPNEMPDREIGELKDFDLNFLKMENDNKNMIYSPLSIKYALNMLNEGASGNTKEQIESVIKDLDVTKYDNINKVLSLANGVYIRDIYSDSVKDEFITILEEKYNAEVRYDPFKNAKSINTWIEDKTLGQIKNLLSDDQISDPSNRMALINALAIDMEWKSDFETDKTAGRDFHLADNTKMQATTMYKETSRNSYSYYKDENVTALTMDLKEYGDTQLEFFAIMPKDNLSEYIKNLSMDDINKISEELILASKTKAGIDIYIPKFKFDYSLDLKKDLKTLGITDAFNENLADFTNMTKEDELYVGEAIHKANIDFTEKGVKAAAVTVFMMDAKSALIGEEEKPIEVRIDNPFMYLIRDKETGEIWFVGTVYEPNNWENDKADYKVEY